MKTKRTKTFLIVPEYTVTNGVVSGCNTLMANQRSKDKQSITMWVPIPWKQALQAQADERGIDLSALCIERATQGLLKAIAKPIRAEKPDKTPKT